MAATDYQSLLSDPGVACYTNLPPGEQRVLMIALLQIIANSVAPNVSTDYQSLLSAPNVKCYLNQPTGIQNVLILALLQIIANNIGSGSGEGTSVLIGNFGGASPPVVTPTFTQGLVVDLPAGGLWAYNSGTFTALIAP